MIPEGKEIGFECVNGHISEKHTTKKVSAHRGSSTPGQMPACIDCGGRLKRTLIPLRECNSCGNIWAYTGDSDRPTCSNCRSKDTDPITD